MWLLRRKAKAESLIFRLDTNAEMYVKFIWFFNSLTVLSPHTIRRVGTTRPFLWQMSCTRSSPRAMISVTQLESCLVHSSITKISSEKPPVAQCIFKVKFLIKCGQIHPKFVKKKHILWKPKNRISTARGLSASADCAWPVKPLNAAWGLVAIEILIDPYHLFEAPMCLPSHRHPVLEATS